MRVKDVAAAAGVSVGTVSNVLNHRGTVAPEYVERVNRAIEELGWVPDDAARSLRSGVSRVVGVVIPDGENPFFTGFVRGAEIAAEPNGGMVLVGHTHGEKGRELHYLNVFAQTRARGVIVQSSHLADDRLGRLHGRGTPVVMVAPTPPDWPTSSIAADNIAGGRLAAAHLMGIGRRRIAFVGGALDDLAIGGRIRGACEVTGEAHGLRVIETPDTTIDSGREAGFALAELPPEDRPDAVFAANDLVAFGLLSAFVRSGIRVPDDIAVIGYDDIPLARAMTPSLSSIRQPSMEMGRAAVELIDDERAGAEPRHVRFEPELVVRPSTVGGGATADG